MTSPDADPTNIAVPRSEWQWAPVLAELNGWLQTHRLHPAEVVVLVPFAQMMAQAREAWGQAFPDSFVPAFETTLNWAQSQPPPASSPDDLTLDVAHDSIVAAALLESVKIRGLDAQWRATLAPQLVQTAHGLAPLVAALPPHQRAAWLAQQMAALDLGSRDGFQRWESLVGALALTWASGSQYPTDVLWAVPMQQRVKALISLPGLAADRLTANLLDHWPLAHQLAPLSLLAPEAPQQSAPISVTTTDTAQDEAQAAAACIIRHLSEGRVPVGIVAQDRLLTKRIHAHLQRAGVDWRDETGWRLSTTRVAAWAMRWLEACAPDADTDTLLDFVKMCPCWTTAEIDAFEAALRAERLRLVKWALANPKVPTPSGLAEILALGQSTQSFDAWRNALLGLLTTTEMWVTGECPEDLAQLLNLLRADVASARGAADVSLGQWLVARPDDWQRLSRARFATWLRGALEAHSYKPSYVGRVEVVALPMAQLYGRSLGAVVLTGCDAAHLPAYVAEESIWTPEQRVLLGLDSSDISTQKAYDAWCVALQFPTVDVFWRQTDGDQVMQPAPWLTLLMAGQAAEGLATQWMRPRAVQQSQDARVVETVTASATEAPAAHMAAVLPNQVSASAYQALRDCPYRFFAQYALRLRDVEELAQPPAAREFGNWIHGALERFHASDRTASSDASASERQRLLDACAQEALPAALREDPDFLPYIALWTTLRDGYLDWLMAHEASGFQIAATEVALTRSITGIAAVKMIGTVDRIDVRQTAEDGLTYVMIDYKTERLDKTKARVTDPTEDTQLAFYIALNEPQRVTDNASLDAFYLNLNSRNDSGGPLAQAVRAKDPDTASDRLITGLQLDWDRLKDNHPVRAIGEGDICTHCAARGLCRKAFWDL